MLCVTLLPRPPLYFLFFVQCLARTLFGEKHWPSTVRGLGRCCPLPFPTGRLYFEHEFKCVFLNKDLNHNFCIPLFLTFLF